MPRGPGRARRDALATYRGGQEQDTVDIENLIGSVVRGALTGKKKKHRGALGYLTGSRRGSSSWINGSTLLAAAGVAWGLYETMQQKGTVSAPTGAPGGVPSGVMSAPPAPAPPGPPPVPAGVPSAPPEVLRVIRLTISAARADGTLTPHEEASILAQARAAGIEALVTRELQTPLPLAVVLDGVSDPKVKQDLYTLAFTIVRADEQVSSGERAYLAQVAHQLGIDPEVAQQLERDAASGIAAASADTTPQ
ncbi:MAG: DUF533 domain-containing protein [Acidobacteria bacterium]|nr:DUF533 domain-containing protein [Acidobacteriota bacterium]